MSKTAALLEEARSLTRAERVEFLARLWESLDDAVPDAPLTDDERALIDRRLTEHRAAPDDTIPAAEVHRRLRQSKRR